MSLKYTMYSLLSLPLLLGSPYTKLIIQRPNTHTHTHTHTPLSYVLLDSNTKLNRKIVTFPLQFSVASPRGASLGQLMSCDKQG